jgi:hypothetical protein
MGHLKVARGESQGGEDGLCFRLACEGQWVWASTDMLGSRGLEDAVQGALALGVVVPGVGEGCSPILGHGDVGVGVERL